MERAKTSLETPAPVAAAPVKGKGEGRGPSAKDLKVSGPAISEALAQAQGSTKSVLNSAKSASGYTRLVSLYDENRKGLFTNRVSGLLVSGASLTPRIQEDGEVQVQTSENYTAKWRKVDPEAQRGDAMRLLSEKDPAKKGEGLAILTGVGLSRALQASNKDLEPSVVKQNEQSPLAKEFIALNAVSPSGDPATGRPHYAQAWMDNGSGGQMPVYGFKKVERTPTGPVAAYKGIALGLDDKGGRTLALVDAVEFKPGVTARGSREILREAEMGEARSIETPEQQRELLEELAAEGWEPIRKVPPVNADLPSGFRGRSEVDVSSKAILALAQAVHEKDVILLGYETALENKPEPAGLTPLQKGLVADYRHLAERLATDGGIKPAGVKLLFKEMSRSTKALGELQATADPLRRDPAAMDPISEFRVIATDLAKGSQVNREAVYALIDDPEVNLLAAVGPARVGEFTAVDAKRKAVLEQLAADLTREIAPERLGKEQLMGEDGQALTFPDGKPRVATPFDEALNRGGQSYDTVRDKYYDLVQATMDSAQNYTSIRLVLASQVGGKAGFSRQEATDLASAYAREMISGTPMDPAAKSKVEEVLTSSGAASAHLDEAMKIHTYLPLVAAHREGLTPAEVGRALEANAKDMEPWSVDFKTYRVYSYNSAPDPSATPMFVIPEQELPETLNPGDAAQVGEVSESRTWKIVRLTREDGRLTPVVNEAEAGLTTAQMIDARLKANQKNIPVLMSRKPLSENLSLGASLAKTYNLPLIETSDPLDGTRGRYAAVGLKVTGTPVASTVMPGYYKALTFGKAPLMEKTEAFEMPDEAAFASSVGLERAKGLVKDHPDAAKFKAVLDDMARPERQNGVYKISTTPGGINAFLKQRQGAIEAMAAVRTARADATLAIKGRGLPPDELGGLRAAYGAEVDGIARDKRLKSEEAKALAGRLLEFSKHATGVTGYTGFAPPLGAGNPAVRIRKPPIELRFAAGVSSLDEAKPRLNRQGLSVELDAFLIEE